MMCGSRYAFRSCIILDCMHSMHCTALHCAPEHDCLRNWYEFSKAMEPDVVVSMAKFLQQEGIKLGALVAYGVLLLESV